MNKIFPLMLSLIMILPVYAAEIVLVDSPELQEEIKNIEQEERKHLERITKEISQQLVVRHAETQLTQNLKTLNARLDVMMSDERVEKHAKATRKLYSELVKAGFTENEAMSIILANAGFLNGQTIK